MGLVSAHFWPAERDANVPKCFADKIMSGGQRAIGFADHFVRYTTRNGSGEDRRFASDRQYVLGADPLYPACVEFYRGRGTPRPWDKPGGNANNLNFHLRSEFDLMMYWTKDLTLSMG